LVCGGKELATEKKKKRHFSHGRTRKNTEEAEAETRKRSIRISHGRTRKNTEIGRSKEFLPQRRQVRKERKAIKGAGRPSASSGPGLFTVSEPVELGLFTVSEPVELAGDFK